MKDFEVYRPRSSWPIFAFAAFLIAGLAMESLTSGDLHAVLSALSLSVGSLLLCYLLFVRPKVELHRSYIRIVNPLSEWIIGWQDVIDIDTKYTLSVKTDTALVHAVAAPAPGRYHARTVHETEVRGLRLPSGELRPGDSPRSHSGVAAHLARLTWQSFDGTEKVATSAARNHIAVVVTAMCFGCAVLLQLLHF